MKSLVERYESIKGDKKAQAELQEELGYGKWSSVRDYISKLRRGETVNRDLAWCSKLGRSEDVVVSHQLEVDTSTGMQTMAIINDTQNPYEDKKSLRSVEHFLEEQQPEYLMYAGDINDFYQISKFNKNPSRADDLEKDISSTRIMFERHKLILPKTQKWFLPGNHERRMQMFLWSSATALSSLECLTLAELFKLKDYNINIVEYEQGVMVNGVFLVLHGDIASIHSGYTAKRMYEKHGGCGMCGHTHKGGSFYKRDRFGIWGWWENFCLCRLDPDWITNPNWTQGFSLVHFIDDRFFVEQIPILNHKFIYGGKIYD